MVTVGRFGGKMGHFLGLGVRVREYIVKVGNMGGE